MKTPKAYIAGVGMITAIGADAAMTMAAINAGVTRVGEVNFYDDDYAALKMLVVPEAAIASLVDGTVLQMPLTARQYRMLQLSIRAIADILACLPGDCSPPLFLAGPEIVVDEEPSIDRLFIENLAIQSGIEIDLENSRYFASGRAGGLDVIDTAIRYFEQDLGYLVLVGGVDTFYDRSITAHYVARQRFLTSNSKDGFLPGEGAGFLLLVSDKAPPDLIQACKSQVIGVGSGFEPGHMGSDKPYNGEGLSTALQMALDETEANGIQVIMSSMNGESYFARELGVAMTRSSGKIAGDAEIHHIAEYCGDLGAAIGPVMVGVLQNSHLLRKGPGLVYCSSDKGYRSAVCIMANA